MKLRSEKTSKKVRKKMKKRDSGLRIRKMNKNEQKRRFLRLTQKLKSIIIVLAAQDRVAHVGV